MRWANITIKATQVCSHFLVFADSQVHIDDLSRNFILNPANGLRVDPFNNGPLQRDDRELFFLQSYLELIAHRTDFTAVAHTHWRSILAEHAWIVCGLNEVDCHEDPNHANERWLLQNKVPREAALELRWSSIEMCIGVIETRLDELEQNIVYTENTKN
jgi:hypothetical protein